MESGPRTASSSNASWTRSATAIGIMRIASRPYRAPRPRNAHPTLRPEIASASVGALMSGGVATFTYARKDATARIFRSNSGNAFASRGFRSRSSSAVRSASPQNVTEDPSGWGANIRTAGVSRESP